MKADPLELAYYDRIGAAPRLTADQERILARAVGAARQRFRRNILQYPCCLRLVLLQLRLVQQGTLPPERCLRLRPPDRPAFLRRLPAALDRLQRTLDANDRDCFQTDPAARRRTRRRQCEAAAAAADLPLRTRKLYPLVGKLQRFAARLADLDRLLPGAADPDLARLEAERRTLLRHVGDPLFAQRLPVLLHRWDAYQQAVARMASCCLRLVVHIARRWRAAALQRGMAFMDVVQEGNRGLLHAIELYDPKYVFYPHCKKWVRHYVTNALERQPAPAASLDDPHSQDDGMVADLLEKRAAPADDAADHAARQELLRPLLDLLTYREREILQLRFGLDGRYCYTAEECGRIFEITRQRVQGIEKEALRKLREAALPDAD